ncbi:protein-disulfide reductase DsbD [Arcobacter sp. FWKO B]|uniref:protein-disulfide reductase DsbD n=1 Tax=Arcobacter sp. FWKO B TaxID=2593672 RepID=UPI0018A4F20A|nr:protein-disulfide reductase DsbD [Arcobacter sp. FWKO B]QOG12552.1 protein-disulfide reductase DsbD [Arcobacter sp. FWKO B]
MIVSFGERLFKNIFLALFLFVSSLYANPFGLDSGGFLEPEEAFKTSVIKEGDYIEFEIVLAKDIYLYQDQLKVLITSPKQQNITDKIQLPEYKEYQDSKAIFDVANISVPISLVEDLVGSDAFALELNFQGCSSAGLCYSPMSIFYDQNLSQGDSPKETIQATQSQQTLSETDEIAQLFVGTNIYLVLATFFGFGLLLSLTPCVFPMIPIISSILVSAQNTTVGGLSSKRGFWLSFVYVFFMSLAYAIAGMMAGVFGANLQSALQNPYVLTAFAAIFVALAMSMFGYYELKVPSFIQSKINKTTDGQEKNGVLGVAIMGFLSALIVGPCVAPPLAGALVYISQTGDAFIGGLALFVMSMGMGVPLLVIGAGAGKFMPRPGGWMENVTKVFGVMMLGLAIWMLDRVLDPSVTLMLWALLLIGSSVYLGLFDPLKEGCQGAKKLKKVFEIVLLLLGASLFVGSLSGATNPVKPFEKFTSGVAISQEGLNFGEIKSVSQLQEIVNSAQKPVMIKFTASWCVSCKELENITLKDMEVIAKLKGYDLYKVDISDNTKNDKELLEYFGLFGPPALLFFNNATEEKGKRIIGYKSPKEFLEIVQ